MKKNVSMKNLDVIKKDRPSLLYGKYGFCQKGLIQIKCNINEIVTLYWGQNQTWQDKEWRIVITLKLNKDQSQTLDNDQADCGSANEMARSHVPYG